MTVVILMEWIPGNDPEVVMVHGPFDTREEAVAFAEMVNNRCGVHEYTEVMEVKKP